MADRIVKIILRGEGITTVAGQLTALGKSAADTGKRLTDAGDKSSAKWRAGLTTVGASAGKMGLVAAAGLGAVVVATANFDKAMSNVQAATHETAANMDRLREAAIQAGADTAFSASEAAAGIENLAKAGVATGDILGGGLAGALDLAAAGGLDVASAAEIAATALTQFRLSGEDVPHVADLLAAAAGKAQGDVSDMSMALKQSGLVASQMGLSIEETTGTLAAFASAGLLGSDAGTSFRTMLLRMANPTKESAELMKQLGINAYDANGQFVGMESLAGQLSTAFQGQSQATRDAALATIFGSDAIRAASVLYQQGADGVADWTTKVDDSGYAAETAGIKLDNLRGDVEKFMGSMETLLIGSGDGSQGMFRGLVQGATDAVNSLNELPAASKSVATGFLGITAVTGGSLWLGSKVVQGIADTRAALEKLGWTADKTKGALSGMAKAGIVVAGAMAADMVADLGDVDYSLDSINRQLVLMGQQGSADNVFKDLSFGAKDLGEALHNAVFNDLDVLNRMLGSNANIGVAKEIKELDEALAGLDPADAKAAFETILDEGKAAGLTVKQIKELFPQYRAELALSAKEAKAAESATKGLASATEGGTAAIEDNTDALQDNIDAMREKRDDALAALDAEIGYQAALDDARAALKENGRTLDISTEKGRANMTALHNQAAAFNNLSDAAKNAPGAHRAAIRSFVDMAVQMRMGRRAAQDLARQILEIPSKRVKIEADTSQAASGIASIRQQLMALDGMSATVVTKYVNQTYGTTGRKMGVPVGADGMTVPGPRQPYGDKVFAFLAPGEEVITNRHGEADRFRADRAAGRIPAYANGGTVQALASGGKVAREFDLSGGLGVSGIRSELQEFRQAVRDTGGEWTVSMQRMSRQAVASARSYEQTSRRLDSLVSARSSLMSDVAGNFNNDPFGNGLAGAFTQLEADRNDANRQTREGRRLQALGLNGAAFQGLMASGDINTMSQIDTRREVNTLERLFAQRASAQAASARVAGSDFAPAIHQLNRQLARSEQTINRLEKVLERVGGNVRQGARDGINDATKGATGKKGR